MSWERPGSVPSVSRSCSGCLLCVHSPSPKSSGDFLSSSRKPVRRERRTGRSSSHWETGPNDVCREYAGRPGNLLIISWKAVNIWVRARVQYVENTRISQPCLPALSPSSLCEAVCPQDMACIFTEVVPSVCPRGHYGSGMSSLTQVSRGVRSLVGSVQNTTPERLRISEMIPI